MKDKINQLIKSKEFELARQLAKGQGYNDLKQIIDFIAQNNEPYSYHIQVIKNFIIANIQGIQDAKFKINWYDSDLIDSPNPEPLPNEIGILADLKWLAIANNELSDLPVDFNKLTKLEYLDLWGNRFTNLPQSMFGLTSLKELNLMFNFFSGKFPSTIGNFINLEVLNLESNQITSMPASFTKLTKLRELNLSDNPIEDAEKERLRELLPSCHIII